MTNTPITITKNKEFHARARKEPDFDREILGFDFSYPVLNTIQIGNLLMRGGTIKIKIERLGESTWSFDKETSELTINRNETDESYIIEDVKELYFEMSEYFNDYHQDLDAKNNDIATKKAKSQLGNQNARKNKDVIENESPKKIGPNFETPIEDTEAPYSASDYKASQSYSVVSPKRGYSEYLG